MKMAWETSLLARFLQETSSGMREAKSLHCSLETTKLDHASHDLRLNSYVRKEDSVSSEC